MGLKRALVFLLMAGWMTVSCAYRFSGADEPPFGIRRISVAMFENKTTETGIETIFANDLINELARDSRLTISRMEKADAYFSGVIKSLSVESASREKTHITLERRVIARADIRLKSQNGKILWTGENLWASDAYRVSPDKRKTEQNLRESIAHISRKMAQNVVQQISWGAGSSQPHIENDIFRRNSN
jgi:hypothetical protein